MQIDEEHLMIENDEEKLPDSKSEEWDLQLAISLLDEQVKRRSINTVFSSFPSFLASHLIPVDSPIWSIP